MSKERLKEIEKRMYYEGYDINPASVEPNQLDDDIAWLIASSRKQTERVQELEKQLKIYEKVLPNNSETAIEIVEENKRYREALEFYADKDNNRKLIIDGNTMYLGKTIVEQDGGKKARQALEESE
jgi:citrate synthase